MNLIVWIALRYIRNQRSIEFSGIIAALAMIGITIGVAAVICVASIFLGFRQLFENLMLRIDPHIRITSRTGKYISAPDSLLRLIKQRSPASIVASLIDGKVIALHRRSVHVLQLRAYDEAVLDSLRGLKETILIGVPPDSASEMLLAAGAAERLAVLPSDTVQLLSPEYLYAAAIGLGIPSALPVRIAGLVLTNDRSYDNTLAITTRRTANQLFVIPDSSITAVDVFCPSRQEGEQLAAQLRALLDRNYRVLTWHDLHRQLYAVMEWERLMSFLLLSLIVLLAVFNIVAMLTMTVASKQRDIAVLRTLGATEPFIGHIFRMQGAIIGIVGTVLGSLVGIGLCLAQEHFHWIMLDTDRYIMQALPVALDWHATIAVAILSMVSSLLASVAPARGAMRVPISSSLRFE